MQYILALLAWALVVLLIAFFAWTICSTRSWDGSEPLYRVIHWMNRNVTFVYFFVTAIGWLVISYLFLARPMEYLDALARVAEALAHPSEEPIVLPGAMNQVETQLNLVRELAQNGGRVLLHGQSCPMVGRMCMDQLFVDVTGVSQVRAGDTATVIGQDGALTIRAEEISRRCGTITNELLSRLGRRIEG